MRVPFLDVEATYSELSEELDGAYRRVMSSGRYLLGEQLEQFEHEFASYVGATSCAGVASGLDALVLGLRCLDVQPGSEVIVPSNTFIATWLAVTAVGATPVPVEPPHDGYAITAEGVAAAISERTSAIVPVHLYGLPADAVALDQLARRSGVPILYDAAQAHGARIGDRPIGAFGDLVAWSFYPGKNLGGFADGGALTGRDASLLDRARRLRNYGSSVKYVHDERGTNSRLDELQAAFLRVKLRHLESWNERRRSIAGTYLRELDIDGLVLPLQPPNCLPVWHLFPIQVEHRDAVQAGLGRRGVETLVHYPIPPHAQAAYADLQLGAQPTAEAMSKRLLSLPIGPHMNNDEVTAVTTAVRGVMTAP